ncbi:MAG: hypothetical protein ABIF19_10160, partial [Planctomycetota bacterium]
RNSFKLRLCSNASEREMTQMTFPSSSSSGNCGCDYMLRGYPGKGLTGKRQEHKGLALSLKLEVKG